MFLKELTYYNFMLAYFNIKYIKGISRKNLTGKINREGRTKKGIANSEIR